MDNVMKNKIDIHNYPTDPSVLPEYQIAVMQAALKENVVVECRAKLLQYGQATWFDYHDSDVSWNWAFNQYRIKKPFTRLEVLKAALPPEYVDLVVANTDEKCGKMHGIAEPHESVDHIIAVAFDWEYAPEGSAFWSKVSYAALCGGDFPPIPEPTAEEILAFLNEGRVGVNVTHDGRAHCWKLGADYGEDYHRYTSVGGSLSEAIRMAMKAKF